MMFIIMKDTEFIHYKSRVVTSHIYLSTILGKKKN